MEWVTLAAKEYGPFAFGLVALCVIWRVIVRPELRGFAAVVKGLEATANSCKAAAESCKAAAETCHGAAQLIRATASALTGKAAFSNPHDGGTPDA